MKAICDECKKNQEFENVFESILIDLEAGAHRLLCAECMVKLSMGGAYRKLWHDRIDDFAIKANSNPRSTTLEFHPQILAIMNSPNLKNKLKAKFDKGMAEHGMNFDKVDFDKEIEDEIVDLCNYFIGKHYSKKEK